MDRADKWWESVKDSHLKAVGVLPFEIILKGAVVSAFNAAMKERIAAHNISRDAIAAVDRYMAEECVAMSTKWGYMQELRAWLQQHLC